MFLRHVALLRQRQFNRLIFILSMTVFTISLLYPFIVSFRSNQVTVDSYVLWLVYALVGVMMFNICSKGFHVVYSYSRILEKNLWIVLSCIGLSM